MKTEEKLIEAKAKLEVYTEVDKRIDAILNGDIDMVEDYARDVYNIKEGIEQEIDDLEMEIEEPEVKRGTYTRLSPEYGPGDTVRHMIKDTPVAFSVMEVDHDNHEYKLTSKNLIKPVTVVIGWSELEQY